MLILNIYIILIFGIFQIVQCANILVIFPFPGRSQFIAGEAYFKELAARGHAVTVASGYPQKQTIPNYRDIPVLSIHDGYKDVQEYLRGEKDVYKYHDYASKVYITCQQRVLDNPAFQDLMKNEQFDLVILEAWHTELLAGLGPHFNAPLMGISTMGTQPSTDDMVGNTSPPSYLPHPFLESGTLDGILARWENLKLTMVLKYIHHFVHMPRERQLFRQYYPHIRADIEEVRRNFSLVLLNQHFSLSMPRPYVTNMIEVGGFFIKQKPSPLPRQMQEFIDMADNGVIYFSMGSNVNSSTLPIKVQRTILRTFASLPERVMWKYETSDLIGKPDNVLISPWFPQSDILAQKNVKLFISHCGALSTTEAVQFGKPILGFPIYFDQFMNAKNVENAGYGLIADLENLTEDSFRKLIRKLIDDQQYVLKAQSVSNAYHDRPMKPLDTAIYWTEYVLRYNGALHLQSAGQKLSLIEYFNLDIFAILLILIMVFVIITFWLVKRIVAWFSSTNKRQSKEKKLK